MNFREKILQKASGAMGINMYRFDSLQTAGGAWWDSGDEDGIKRKGVYTDAFWLAPPYGRPRDIDYDRLEKIEKSVWVRMCVQHIVDRIANAEWNIVPVKKGEDVPQQNIDKPTEFFNGMGWDAPLSQVLRMMLPDAIQYDAGMILKSYPVIAYEKENWRLKSTKLPPVQLYARDGRSFMLDTNLFGQVKTYWQYSWINPQGKPIEFNPDEIIYFQKSPQSRGPYGIASLEIIEEIIDYMIDSTLAQSKYWKNGLFVGGQIDLPDVRDLDELKRQQAYFEAKLRGPRKYNKWIVTGGGAKVQSMPFTSQQMQFIDSQKWFAKMVFGVFSLTPSELGFTEDLNKATGIQQMEIHKSKGVRPWLKLIEDMFNRHIVWKDFSDDVKFEFVRELDLADKKIQVEIDTARLSAGLDSVNELRLRDGLEAWDDEKYDLPSGDSVEEPVDGGETDEELGWEGMFDDVEDMPQFSKGGKGSGIKGHKTYRDDVKKYRQKAKELDNTTLKSVAKKLELSPHIKGEMEEWFGGFVMSDLDNLVTNSFKMDTKSSRISNETMVKKQEITDENTTTILKLYAANQEMLKRKHPGGKITLYRGVDGKTKEKFNGMKFGDSVPLDCYNLSSWSSEKDISELFANNSIHGGVVIKTVVPINRILHHYEASNMAYGEEEEHILMGSKVTATIEQIVPSKMTGE